MLREILEKEKKKTTQTQTGAREVVYPPNACCGSAIADLKITEELWIRDLGKLREKVERRPELLPKELEKFKEKIHARYLEIFRDLRDFCFINTEPAERLFEKFDRYIDIAIDRIINKQYREAGLALDEVEDAIHGISYTIQEEVGRICAEYRRLVGR